LKTATAIPRSLKNLIVLFLVLSALYSGLQWSATAGILAVPGELLMVFRWMLIALLLYFGSIKKSLTTWILISMVVGGVFGHDFPEIGVHLKLVSKIFIRLIKTIIAPLLLGTLIVGIAGHSNLKQVGRMGWKSLVYFEIVTTIALIIGLVAINLTKAGQGISLPPGGETLDDIPHVDQGWQDVVLHVFPENLAKSVAEGQVLQIVIFAILFGIGVAMVPEKQKRTMLDFTESLSEVMFKFTQVIMYFAPFAVGAALAYTVSHMGFGILMNLIQLLLTLYGALAAFLLLVLLPVALLVGVPIKRFIYAIAEPVSLAFATTSSEAALPKAMKAMEGMGVPRKIVAFVMPTGYSFNLDGTTLYLALASVFVAQAAGIDLSWEKQLVMVLTLMLTSKGVAGVPRASLVILMSTAVYFGLPIEPIFIILGIDELMDMARTSVNVIGNCLATIVVAKWEGEFNPDAPVAEIQS